jgi:calcineurin-like phosphoesterase family protein
MSEIFLISDLHLGHDNVLHFQHPTKEGPLRPFKSIDEMHHTIITNWNSVVTDKDKVYVLGDVAMTEPALKLLAMMNGHKHLIMGNHDKYQARAYLQYFEKLGGLRQINGVWLSHAPMHESCVNQERVKINAHGHLHGNIIDSPKYRNVCVENINYTPISVDEVMP